MFVMGGGGTTDTRFFSDFPLLSANLLSDNSLAFFVKTGKKATFLSQANVYSRTDCASSVLSFTRDFSIQYSVKYITLASYGGVFTTADLGGYYTGGYTNEWGAVRRFTVSGMMPDYIAAPPLNVWVDVTIERLSSVLKVKYDDVTQYSANHSSTVTASCPLVIGCTDQSSRGKFYLRRFTIQSRPLGATTASTVFQLAVQGGQIIDSTGNHELVNVPSTWGYGNNNLVIA